MSESYLHLMGSITNTVDLEQLEERLRQAMLTSDVVELDRLMADQLVFVLPDGVVVTKTADLDAHRSGKIRIHALKPSEQVIQEHENFGVVTVRMAMAGSYDGTPLSGDFRYTRVWHLAGTQPQIIAGHVSAIK